MTGEMAKIKVYLMPLGGGMMTDRSVAKGSIGTCQSNTTFIDVNQLT
mgnify:CR=1 FL=1